MRVTPVSKTTPPSMEGAKALGSTQRAAMAAMPPVVANQASLEYNPPSGEIGKAVVQTDTRLAKALFRRNALG